MTGDRFGSTTDLITNLTTFPRLRLRAEIREMFRWGPSPERHLQSFLHEATHHWCFHSTVGAALSTLSLRVRIDASRLVDERTPDRGLVLQRLVNTLTRQRVAQACLGPFVEGLALFAEFDATPRVRTRVRSAVMNQVAVYFGMPVPGTTSTETLVLIGDSSEGIPEVQQEIDRWLLLVLGRSRTTAACVDRKANILVHPFDVTSGYLPGYLFVKALWTGMARRVPRLAEETDLLLTYVRHHVFENPQLVRVLLDTSDDDPTAIAAAVAQAVNDRFEALLDVRPEHLEMFEQVVDSDTFSWDDQWFLRSLQVEPADRRAAMDMLGGLVDLWEDGPSSGADNLEQALRIAWQAAMAGRSFISMGAMPLTFAVRGGKLVCPDEPELVAAVGQASPLWLGDHGETAGSAELLFVEGERRFPTRLLAFTTCDRLSGLAVIPAAEPAEMRTWLGLLERRTTAAGGIIRSTGALLEMVRPLLMEDTRFGQVEGALRAAVESMYLPWSLAGVPDAHRRAELAAAMRDKGLRGVLGSVQDVRSLAALSLCAMRTPHLEFVESDLRARDMDPVAVLSRLTALSEQQGFPWITVVERCVLAMI